MGIALSSFRERAQIEFPGLDIELENDEILRLLPVTELTDDQLDRFSEAQKTLEESDESEDLKKVRRSFVTVLSEVSVNPARTREVLDVESLGTLIEIFKAYSESVNDASKSASTS
jgi:hypothetical protein